MEQLKLQFEKIPFEAAIMMNIRLLYEFQSEVSRDVGYFLSCMFQPDNPSMPLSQDLRKAWPDITWFRKQRTGVIERIITSVEFQ